MLTSNLFVHSVFDKIYKTSIETYVIPNTLEIHQLRINDVLLMGTITIGSSLCLYQLQKHKQKIDKIVSMETEISELIQNEIHIFNRILLTLFLIFGSNIDSVL